VQRVIFSEQIRFEVDISNEAAGWATSWRELTALNGLHR